MDFKKLLTETREKLADAKRQDERVEAYVEATEKARKKSEAYWKKVGEYLSRVRDEHKRLKINTPWRNFTHDEFGLSQQRVDELIRIYKGDTTLEKSRERKREGMREHRKPPPQNKRGSGKSDDNSKDKGPIDKDEEPDDDPEPDDQDDNPEPEGLKRDKRERIALSEINDSYQSATQFALMKPEAKPEEITDVIMEGVKDTAQAWAELCTKLERKRHE